VRGIGGLRWAGSGAEVGDRRPGEPTEDERRRAVAHLAAAVPRVVWELLRTRVAERDWPALHFGTRRMVRDLIRRGGFGWDELYLDDHWLELALEAASQADEGAGN
jgi:hypothetical protein